MGVEFTQSGDDILIREDEDGEKITYLPSFVVSEFNKWWLLHGFSPEDDRIHIARSAWIEAYCRGLDVNY